MTEHNSRIGNKSAAQLTIEFIDDVNNRISKLERAMFKRYGIIFIGMIVFAAGIAYSVHKANNASDQAKTLASRAAKQAAETRKLTAENAALSQRIQNERKASSVDQCKNQNTRNKNTINKLQRVRDDELKTVPPQIVDLFRAAGMTITNPRPLIEVEAASIKSSFASTKTIIEAAVPYSNNCSAKADKIIHQKP